MAVNGRRAWESAERAAAVGLARCFVERLRLDAQAFRFRYEIVQFLATLQNRFYCIVLKWNKHIPEFLSCAFKTQYLTCITARCDDVTP